MLILVVIQKASETEVSELTTPLESLIPLTGSAGLDIHHCVERRFCARVPKFMKTVRAQYPFTEAEAVRGTLELKKSAGLNSCLFSALGIIFLLLGIAGIAISGIQASAIFLIFLGVMLASASQWTAFLAKRGFKKSRRRTRRFTGFFPRRGRR